MYPYPTNVPARPSPRRHALYPRFFAFLILLALAGAPSARSQQQPNNEFGVWGAYSFSSPNIIGNPAHMQFGQLAFRYARLLHSSPVLGIEYTIDVETVEITQPEIFPSCEIMSGGILIVTDCPTHEYVYAGGLSPIGWKFNFTFDFQAGIQHFNASRTRAWTFAYKFQHISDANRTNVNPGVNFNMFSVGYSFFR